MVRVLKTQSVQSIGYILFCTQIVPIAIKKIPTKPIITGFIGIYLLFRGNLPYRLLGQNLYPLHRFRLSKSRHRFPRNTLTLISHIITTGSPVLLSDIVTDVATNRIYTGFSPHLHCRTQKRPCQFGRNSEPTRSFSYTYLLRVLPQISFSSQAKGFAKNEDKSFALGISAIQTRQVVALT